MPADEPAILREARAQAMSTRDRLLAIVVVVISLWPLTFRFVAPRFEGMYRDFGSHEALPFITQLALSWWFSILLLLPGLLTLAYAFRAPPEKRHTRVRAALIVAMATNMMGSGLFVVAMYLPIFALAGQIKG